MLLHLVCVCYSVVIQCKLLTNNYDVFNHHVPIYCMHGCESRLSHVTVVCLLTSPGNGLRTPELHTLTVSFRSRSKDVLRFMMQSAVVRRGSPSGLN